MANGGTDDPRSPKQRQKDAMGVSRQVSGYARAARQGRERLFLHALARRQGNPRRMQFEPDRPDGRALVVPQELLTRSEHGAAVAAALGDRVAKVLAVDCLEGRVTRLVLRRSDPADAWALQAALADARRIDPEASLNHVMPLGPVAKGLDGPEVSSVPSTYVPPNRPGPVVPVAVIDTGITAEVRTDGWLTGIDRSTANRDPLNVLGRDRFLDFGAGHGTFVTGVIQQVAGDIAEIEVYRALDSDGVGSDVGVACALLEAVERGARIVNLSVGTESDDGEPLAMKVALEILAERDDDVLIVAAAGNSGLDGNHRSWPAALERVVAVAGLDADGRTARWSTHGDWVQFSAIAEGVVSTYVEGEESSEIDDEPDRFPRNAWATWTGTSFAAPQVVGAIAGLLADDPNRTVGQAVEVLAAAGPRTKSYGTKLTLLPGTKLAP
jgi:subtilisin family serine protease